MEKGTIVEYIDQQHIICAVVMDCKNDRLSLINEYGREITQSSSRIFFASGFLDEYDSSSEVLVSALKNVAEKRRNLISTIDLKELWLLVNEQNEWISLKTLTEFVFPLPVTPDQTSAMIRAVFLNRLYFKFDHTRFFPHTPEQVERILTLAEEERKKKRLIEEGGKYLKKIINEDSSVVPEHLASVPEILKSFYIYDKESHHYQTCKEMLALAGVNSDSAVFKLLVKLGEFDENENLDIYRLNIRRHFPDNVLRLAEGINVHLSSISDLSGREDFTHLQVITVDGQSTVDHDDALSIEQIGDSIVLGIHISDVAHLIKRGDEIDKRAVRRGATIYMADERIPMIPSAISERAASLKCGEIRPAISVFVVLNRFFEIRSYEVKATSICVNRHLCYSEASIMAEGDKDLCLLIKIARAFREKRLNSGALHISIPEINVHIDEDGDISISRVDRENPSRMMISEMMIMANWLMASFLARNNTPAFFRSQPEPKERLYKGESDSIFLNCLQRKFINRAVISQKPALHAGLGLDAYVTATSPIRRYHDLVTQRQIRAVLGLEEPYSSSDISRLALALETPVANVGRIQANRKKYWLLKYLENLIGTKTPGFVLDRKKNSYTVVLTDYMLEYNLPASGLKLKPHDMVTLTIQQVNARKDSFAVYLSY